MKAGVCTFVVPLVLVAASVSGEVSRSGDAMVETRALTALEIAALKAHFGVAEPGVNYNRIVDGHGTGLKPPTEEQWEYLAKFSRIVESVSSVNGRRKIAAAVDQTTSPYFPPIGSQGMKGTCACFSGVYYMKTFQEAQEHGWDLSGASWSGGEPTPSYQNRIFSPDFAYHQINGGLDEGSSLYDIANLTTHVGACSWQKMPYNPSDYTTWPPEAAWREAPIYRGQGFMHAVDIHDTAGMNQLKQLLDNGVLLSIGVDSDYMLEMTTTDDYPPGYEINHAVTVVGYDDSKSYSEDGTTHYGAVKLANSWGSTWTGETTMDGCFWMSYNLMMDIITWAQYYDDQIGYEPRILAVFEITHPIRSECVPYLMIGGSDEPLWSAVRSSSLISTGWNDLPVDPPISVTAGDDYRITLASSQDGSSGSYYWGASFSDVYPGESNFYMGGDYCFRTYTTGDVLDQAQESLYWDVEFHLLAPAWQNFIPTLSPLTKLSVNVDYDGSPGYLVATVSEPPLEMKPLYDDWSVGAHPYPSNPMALDITEFSDKYDAGAMDFYLKVLDELDGSTGTITHFSVEIYDDYSSGLPQATFTSGDPPEPIPDGGTACVGVLGSELPPGPVTSAQYWEVYE